MSIESLKQQARKHEQNEDWKKALEQYGKALAELARQEQVDIGLYNRVGDLYVRVGQIGQAVEHYEKAVELYREAYLPNNAIAVCKKIIRNVPDRHRAYLVIGQIRAEQGFLPDARTNFLTYAERMQQAGDLDESFRALIEFCDLAPEDIGVRVTVAEQMIVNGRKDDGVQQLLVVHRHYKQQGDHNQAEDIKTRILTIDPETDFDALPPLTAVVTADDDIDDGLSDFSFGSGIADDSDDISERTESAMEEAAGDDDFEEISTDLPMMQFGEESSTGDDDADAGVEDDLSLPMVSYDATEEDDLQDRWASDPGAAGTSEDDDAAFDFSIDTGDGAAEEELDFSSQDDDLGEALEFVAAVEDSRDEESGDENLDVSAGFEDDLDVSDDAGAPDLPTLDGGFDAGSESPGDSLEGLSLSAQFSEAAEPDVAGPSAGDAADDSGSESDAVEPASAGSAPVDSPPVEPEPELAASGSAERASSKPASVEPEPEPASNGAAPAAHAEPKAPEPSEGYVDLGAMILGGGPSEEKSTRFTVQYQEPSGDEEADFARMLSQFKDKVSENLDSGDVRAHYDLGTAYKEMGLLDEAVSSFQAALRASADHLPTYELLGQTFIDLGKPEAAVRSLERALQASHTVEDELVGIYYYLGRAHEALDNRSSAVEFYDRVFALDINFADVTERLRELR